MCTGETNEESKLRRRMDGAEKVIRYTTQIRLVKYLIQGNIKANIRLGLGGGGVAEILYYIGAGN